MRQLMDLAVSLTFARSASGGEPSGEGLGEPIMNDMTSAYGQI
jgi:hypothetical protein